MATAKVFKSGNSQALRLPRQFRLDSTEVEIFRRGDEIVLREKPRTMAREPRHGRTPRRRTTARRRRLSSGAGR